MLHIFSGSTVEFCPVPDLCLHLNPAENCPHGNEEHVISIPSDLFIGATLSKTPKKSKFKIKRTLKKNSSKGGKH
jgi:hypothetical protein